MKVIINSKEQEISCKTVADLAQELGLPDSGVALAVNSEMIPRDNWQGKQLNENDDILIIKAASGG
ncbi:MAG: sulfur carrier protein ThiS [Bacteroidales bacterium]|jgi:sulfur carrier protein|nr:sulfur carrier protein ThiS [Bacteroidales bacterium]MBR6278656.1 sulfur carrier protein ThiS [Bacteroidales bacterium]